MEELEKVNFEIVNKKEFDIKAFFLDNKETIYSLLFYLFGLILGSYFYSIAKSETINTVLTETTENFTAAFIANLTLYLSVFLIIVLMGFSLIGFSVVNAIPVLLGMFYGMKCACYYSLHSGKGVGYIMLLIAPTASLFLSLVIYSIGYNSSLSKMIFSSVKNEKNRGISFEVKPLFLQIIIQLVLFLSLAVINSGLSVALGNLITI
ncbi:MAG: stage II sporulation protein M [Acetobacter sp.]|nr:stage II sporulation protein M [Bacteroides sp.]MCM1340563.1 stage II sporulation protein M [Acetobacter sp.]MCM1433303.1 stage II sporulation protein M [Clostridiales bacterium]